MASKNTYCPRLRYDSAVPTLEPATQHSTSREVVGKCVVPSILRRCRRHPPVDDLWRVHELRKDWLQVQDLNFLPLQDGTFHSPTTTVVLSPALAFGLRSRIVCRRGEYVFFDAIINQDTDGGGWLVGSKSRELLMMVASQPTRPPYISRHSVQTRSAFHACSAVGYFLSLYCIVMISRFTVFGVFHPFPAPPRACVAFSSAWISCVLLV